MGGCPRRDAHPGRDLAGHRPGDGGAGRPRALTFTPTGSTFYERAAPVLPRLLRAAGAPDQFNFVRYAMHSFPRSILLLLAVLFVVVPGTGSLRQSPGQSATAIAEPCDSVSPNPATGEMFIFNVSVEG